MQISFIKKPYWEIDTWEAEEVISILLRFPERNNDGEVELMPSELDEFMEDLKKAKKFFGKSRA